MSNSIGSKLLTTAEGMETFIRIPKPTVEQLARLAAQLNQEGISSEARVTQAWEIWEAACVKIENVEKTLIELRQPEKAQHVVRGEKSKRFANFMERQQAKIISRAQMPRHNTTSAINAKPQWIVGYKEAAKYVGCAEKTIGNWIRDGHLKPERRGKIVEFKTEDLDKFRKQK